jgi:ankyrin repeat protein
VALYALSTKQGKLSAHNFKDVKNLFSLSRAHMAMTEAAQLLTDVFGKADCKALQLYIKKGYDTCVLDQQQCTLLHLSASFTCSDCDKGSMARTLIEQGVQVDARDNEGFTALMKCKTKAVAKVLLEHGAELNADSDRNKGTCFMYAVLSNNLPLVQLFLREGAYVSAVADGNTNALHIAC